MRNRVSSRAGAAIFLGVLAGAAGGAVALLGTGPAQLRAVAMAAVVAGVAALAGWFVARWGRGKSAGLAVAGGLGATLVRLFPVLIALGWLVSREEGMGPGRPDLLLVIFYLLMLATDVLLNMIGAPETMPARGGATPN